MRSISVNTLLGDRNLRRIDYKPYYQRNYVWDNQKASFFIESVMLGTDIPPLILFKSGRNVEVIDGRQRFETLKRFKEGVFKLSSKGLKDLKVLAGDRFNDLNDKIKLEFLETKVRLFEFEVVNEPTITPILEDKIKKEIFRRYNTGITPITRSELDNAKYDDDEVTSEIKDVLNSDAEFRNSLVECFFKKKPTGVNDAAISDFFRRFITLKSFPIRSYADSGRTDTRELLYDFITSSIDNSAEFIDEFKTQVSKVIKIYKGVKRIDTEVAENKLIFECLLWGLTILKNEGVDVVVDEDLILSIKDHYKNALSIYDKEGSHFYGNIIARFSDTASFLSKKYSCSLDIYIKDESFSSRLNELRQTEGDSIDKISVLKSLRLLKPEPSSEPVEEIISDLKTSRYLLRPSYQRQEKISIFKASAIIESILLGIYLPPVFIYKNSLGVKEVIDGQQRLLSVLAYLGKTYLDERGEINYSKNNNFSLKGLRVLKEFTGKRFSDLPEDMQDKIFDFDINIIEIDCKLNEEFDQVDLFIRLNNKPYPIKENSFEMWNSTVVKDVIKELKDFTKSVVEWFYIRIINRASSRDRMENEELITVLSYLNYMDQKDSTLGGIEFFSKTDRLSCRISNKAGVTAFLNSLEASQQRKTDFLESIGEVRHFVEKIEILLQPGQESMAEKMNDLINVKNTQSFSRTMQDFYLLWLCFKDVPFGSIDVNRDELKQGYKRLLHKVKNTEDVEITSDYLEQFKKELSDFTNEYSG